MTGAPFAGLIVKLAGQTWPEAGTQFEPHSADQQKSIGWMPAFALVSVQCVCGEPKLWPISCPTSWKSPAPALMPVAKVWLKLTP